MIDVIVLDLAFGSGNIVNLRNPGNQDSHRHQRNHIISGLSGPDDMQTP